MKNLQRFGSIESARAAERLRGVVERTPLVPCRLDAVPPGVALSLKLECLQVTGSFKARGAWNQVSQLTHEQRARGVAAASSGNHGKALAWAARRAGVPAVICMPADAYPNKIEACRAEGAEVVLAPDRVGAERACAERVAAGAVEVPPYDAERTVEGAGTVGLEIAQDSPDVDVVVVPVGGGGLLAGSALALKRALGDRVRVVGVEPSGAAGMARALDAGCPVDLARIESGVQGLCPPRAGTLNLAVVQECVDLVLSLDDPLILDAQEKLVNEAGLVVEPAGAAAVALVLSGGLPEDWLPHDRDLRVVAVVSGGNPAPEQLAAVRARSARAREGAPRA